MQSRLLAREGDARMFVVVLESGEEALSCLSRFVQEQGVTAAQITAVGAFSEVVLKYFDYDRKAYREIPVPEQVEVASLIGDVALGPDGQPAIHIHLVVGRRDGSALAGHLGSGKVRPTLEVVIHEAPVCLQKVHDPQTGLALIRPQAG